MTSLKDESEAVDLKVKFECERIYIKNEYENTEPHTECNVEENASNYSEAVDIDNSKCIKEENNVLFDYEKKVFVSIKSEDSFSEPTLENQMNIFRNATDLEDEPKDIYIEEKVTFKMIWPLKVESKEIHIKHETENCDNVNEREFADVSCNNPLWSNTEEQIYKCHLCEKIFTSKDQLNLHLEFHSSKKQYRCEICEKTFLKSGNLKRHLFIHKGEKLYKCEICQKTFSASGNLKTHMSIHTGKKKYKCNICRKKFVHGRNLNRHFLIHTGEKNYKCESCLKTFSRSEHLKTHLLIHTGEKKYKCETCQKTFSRSGYLKTHLLVHTGEKMYKCEICHKKFSRKFILQNHLQIHTGEKKFT